MLAYYYFKSTAAFFAPLVAGILIDADHILDYYLQCGITLKLRKIYLWCLERKFKFLFLCFHSVELLFMLWGAISLFKLGASWIAFAVGLTAHLVLDMLFNKILYIYSYFLIFRIIMGFRKENILRVEFLAP